MPVADSTFERRMEYGFFEPRTYCCECLIDFTAEWFCFNGGISNQVWATLQ